MCAHDLELGVEVKGEENETSECCGRMTRRHRFQRVVDIILVAGTNGTVKHEVGEARSIGSASRNVGLANGIEMGAQTTDQPFDEDLEDRSGNET